MNLDVSKETITCMSFNLSGVNDMANTARFFSSKTGALGDIATKFLKSSSADQNQFFDNTMCNYLSKLNAQKLLPNILFIQELIVVKNRQGVVNNYEHTGVIKKIEALGYTLLCGQDTAIAYKNDKFSIIQHGSTPGQAYFADLCLKTTGVVIRAVSDHISWNAELGLEALKSNLEYIDPEPRILKQKNLWEKIETFFSKDLTASVILYAGDLNTIERDYSLQVDIATLEEMQSINQKIKEGKVSEDEMWKKRCVFKKERDRSDRLKLFNNKGYKKDELNHYPTNIDCAGMQKIDYFFGKTVKPCIAIDLKEKIIKGINTIHGLINLEDPSDYPPSDHLPVLTDVNIYSVNPDSVPTTFKLEPPLSFTHADRIYALLERLKNEGIMLESTASRAEVRLNDRPVGTCVFWKTENGRIGYSQSENNDEHPVNSEIFPLDDLTFDKILAIRDNSLKVIREGQLWKFSRV